jgi:hypothetical protein
MSRLRLILSVIGLGLAAVGAITDNRILVWAAIVVISVSIAIRIITRARRP